MVCDSKERTKQFKKRLYNFTLRLVEFLDTLPSDNVSKRIGDQLLRSGTSILGNYVEGYAASSKKDCANYFNTALKSANESKLWMTLLRDTKRTAPEHTKWFLDELSEIANIFGASLLTLRGKRNI
ncbi:MAG: four helix bundle protein [Planctomycetaceae bacterium]|nr:four helix bundle protein [Planctomycetaceae bacterium]